MSAGRIVRVSIELPAGAVVGGGLADAMRDITVGSDGTLRAEAPHPMRLGDVVGTWAVIDWPRVPE